MSIMRVDTSVVLLIQTVVIIITIIADEDMCHVDHVHDILIESLNSQLQKDIKIYPHFIFSISYTRACILFLISYTHPHILRIKI